MLFDPGVVETLSSALPLWLFALVVILSQIGSIYVIAPGVVLAYLFGDRERTATWLGIIIAAYGLFVAVKPLTDVPRPDVEPPFSSAELPALLVPLFEASTDFETGSFPSGHTLASTVFWGLVMIDLRVSTFRRRFLTGVTVVSVVCFARVALATHYVGDVVGGVVLGLALLGFLLPVRRYHPNPATALLALAALPASAGILLGRPIDGAILLVTIVSAYVGNRRIDSTWQPDLQTIRKRIGLARHR